MRNAYKILVVKPEGRDYSKTQGQMEGKHQNVSRK